MRGAVHSWRVCALHETACKNCPMIKVAWLPALAVLAAACAGRSESGTLAPHAVDPKAEVARAQTEYAEARLRAAARPVQHKSADAAAARIVALKKAKLDRYRALLATHDVTLQEVEDAENEYAAAQRDLINVENAAPAAPQTRVAEIELERARADERLAESRRQTLVVRAPIAGVVARKRVV